MTKRTLITKLSTDVSFVTPQVLKALQDLHKATFESVGFTDVSFEVVEAKEDAAVISIGSLLRSVYREFCVEQENGESQE